MVKATGECRLAAVAIRIVQPDPTQRMALDAIAEATRRESLHLAVVAACGAYDIKINELDWAPAVLYPALSMHASANRLYPLADAFDLAHAKHELWDGDQAISNEALDAVYEAIDAVDLWEVATYACALYGVPLAGSMPYSETALTARSRGLHLLADALNHGDEMQTRFERDALADLAEPDDDARRCYGCDQPIDAHAPARVVYCGRCGDER